MTKPMPPQNDPKRADSSGSDAREAPRLSEAMYRELVENANSAILRWKSDGTLTFLNAYALDFFGYGAEEIVGRHVGVLVPETDSSGLDMRALVRDILEFPERYVRNVNENVCRDGRRVWMAWTNRPILDEKGEVTEILAIGTDISERLRIDEALRESEEKFRSAFANATIGFAMTDPSGRFLDANAAYCRITGHSIDELRALRFQDLIHPQDSAENLRLIDRMLSGGMSDFAVDNRYLRKDGDSVWVHKNVSLVRDAEGEPKWILALIQDISGQKRAEESLLQSEARLRALAEGLPQIVWTANTRGEIEWFNRRFYEYTGEDPHPAGDTGWGGIVHPDDLAPTVLKWERSFREGTLFETEVRTRGRDGRYRWFLVRAWPMLDPEGGIVRWFGTSTDIHGLKETEAALRQSREDFTRAQEVGQIGWWRLDLRQDILTWSDENYRIFGIPAGTPMNYEKFLAVVHPEDRDQVDRAWQAGLQSGSYSIEHRILAGGETRWVREKAYPEFDGEGNLLGGFGISQDITERKRAEQEVRRLNETLERRVAERTAEVRQQADQLRALATQLSQAELRERKRLAGILHDHIQQLIVAARMQLGRLKRDAGRGRMEETATDIDAILMEALEASRSLTMDLSPPALHESGLAGALEWLAGRIGEKTGTRVTLCTDKAAEPAGEEMRFLLFECARELLFNAVKHAAVAEVGLGLWRTDDGKIKLIVSDRGKGFDPRILRNRRPGEMTFGLFSVQERLMHMGGAMEVDSAPGRGTVVTLWAPAGDRPGSAGGEPPQPPAERGIRAVSHRRRRCRVLIVDDHKIMRDGLKGLLQFESDIEVVGGAADGAEALALTRELRPDVVIMDVNLGKMTGIDVTRRIKAEIPATNIIGLSMHLDVQIADAMKEAGAAAYLSKGGPAEDLIAAIRGCGRD
jgi:PAS domain S-box-containing protein